MGAGAYGFWSYVHDDDRGDHGRITALSKDLRDQYRILTSEQLELFLDRESIRWGEEWENLIANAIAGTTFFIPIVTPSYFRSNACRQELLKFVREAERAGLGRLLMPVYWVDVPELNTEGKDSKDEAIRAIATHQWRSLREVRLDERDSSTYRRAVSDLAAEIAERATEVAENVEDVPPAAERSLVVEVSEADEDAPGFLDRLARGDEALEEITAIMQEIGGGIETVGALAVRAGEEIDAAVAQGQGSKRALVITNRLAHELEDPAAQLEERGLKYVTTLGDLDAAVQIRLDAIAEKTQDLDDDEVEYLDSVEGLSGAADEALSQLNELMTGIDAMSKVSRSLRAPARRMRAGVQGVLDGRAIIAEWGQRATELRTASES